MTMGDDVSVEQGIGTGAEGRLVRLFLHVKARQPRKFWLMKDDAVIPSRL
jgi:hypothetical protein